MSWGECGPAFGAWGVLVACEEGGQRLERLRLVPDDRRGGRDVSDIDRVSVVLVTGS